MPMQINSNIKGKKHPPDPMETPKQAPHNENPHGLHDDGQCRRATSHQPNWTFSHHIQLRAQLHYHFLRSGHELHKIIPHQKLTQNGTPQSI